MSTEKPLPDASSGPPLSSRRWWRWVGGAVIVLVAGFVVVWEAGLKYDVFPKRFGVVVPGRIYRSGQISRRCIEKVLRDYQIQTIVDLNGLDPADEDQAAEIALARQLNIPLIRLPLRGNGTGDIRCYARALVVMHRAVQENRPVLVHCHAGSKRAGAAVAFYRLLIQGRPAREVLAEMERYDCTPSRSPVLIRYINRHLRELAERLVAAGVLQEVPQPLPQLQPGKE